MQLVTDLAQQMVGEVRNVAPPVPERRDGDLYDPQPKVEILAKRIAPHQLLERPVRRRNDARPCCSRLLRAHGIELTAFQHPQELGLEIGAHVADLVQEHRSRSGDLEIPLPRRDRAGKGPAHVTEQLRLEQRLRERRAVDCHERLTRLRRVVVDRARDALLSRPRFASDQYRGAIRRQHTDQLVDLDHRRIAPHQVLEGVWCRRFRGQVLRPTAELALAEAPVHQQIDVIQIQWLHQVVVRPGLHGAHRGLHILEGRDHDDVHVRDRFSYASQ